MESRDRHNAISRYAIAAKSCSLKTIDFNQKKYGNEACGRCFQTNRYKST